MKKSAKSVDLNFDFNSDTKGFMDLPEWKRLEKNFSDGTISHCVAITAPLEWHEEILYKAAELFLGINKNVLKNNDDLIVLGELEKAPKIDDCRRLINEIALKPVSSPKNRRLAVIMAADKLLKPAANSLLKLSEEPPAHACILFLLDAKGKRLMPTLKSRAQFVVLKDLKKDYNSDENFGEKNAEGLKEPENNREWLDFTAKFRNLDYLQAAGALGEMAEKRLERGKSADLRAAGRLERLRIIAAARRLSAPMLCDLVMLSLKGGMPFERLFDDF